MDINKDVKQDQNINSIVRAIALLSLYGKLEVQDLGISEISKHLNLHKTTVFRIVKTLEGLEWLKKNSQSGKYRLGLRVLAVSSAVPRESFEDLIKEEMKRLGRIHNEDVVLSMLAGDMSICIEKIRSTHNLRTSSKVGFSNRLVKGATAKTLLAFQSDEFISDYLDRHFDQSIPDHICERARLEENITKIRRQGYSATFAELDKGTAAIAIPLYDNRNNILYSLGIIGAESRMQEKGTESILKSLMETAERLKDQFTLLG